MPASPITDLTSPVAVVCHDAGGANVILSWLRAGGADGCRFYLEGPAARLWASSLPTAALKETLEAALEGSSTLVSGTGWASDLEHRARKLAQESGIRSVAVLDHWVNYAERFERGGVTVLPDELWVTDSYALEKAGGNFPKIPLRQFENPYIAEQLRHIPAVPSVETADILYVLEPARSTWGRTGEGEFQALDYFVEALPRIGPPRETSIRLRPHPSDAPGKYNGWIEAQRNLDIRIDDSPDMAAAIAPAGWVAGCESFGLVLALEAGRTVFCTLPPWAPPCRLPHSGLIHLKSLELK